MEEKFIWANSFRGVHDGSKGVAAAVWGKPSKQTAIEVRLWDCQFILEIKEALLDSVDPFLYGCVFLSSAFEQLFPYVLAVRLYLCGSLVHYVFSCKLSLLIELAGSFLKWRKTQSCFSLTLSCLA
jgi:hypothetical protein